MCVCANVLAKSAYLHRLTVSVFCVLCRITRPENIHVFVWWWYRWYKCNSFFCCLSQLFNYSTTRLDESEGGIGILKIFTRSHMPLLTIKMSVMMIILSACSLLHSTVGNEQCYFTRNSTFDTCVFIPTNGMNWNSAKKLWLVTNLTGIAMRIAGNRIFSFNVIKMNLDRRSGSGFTLIRKYIRNRSVPRATDGLTEIYYIQLNHKRK